MQGMSYEEFLAQVPTIARMSVDECRRFCDAIGVSFYSIDEEDHKALKTIQKIYSSHKIDMSLEQIFQMNGGFILRAEKGQKNTVWLKAVYNKEVTPGVFYHEMGHHFEFAFFSEEAIRAYTTTAAREHGLPANEASVGDVREAFATAISAPLAVISTRMGVSPPERMAGVLEQMISDAGYSIFIEDAVRFFCREYRSMRNSLGAASISEAQMSYLRAYADSFVNFITSPLFIRERLGMGQLP